MKYLNLFSYTFILILFCTGVTLSQPVILWDSTYGGSGRDGGMEIMKVKGGFMAASRTSSFDFDINSLTDPDGSGSHFGEEFWIKKLDPNGQILWQNAIGGSGSEQITAFDTTLDGGYILTGFISPVQNGDLVLPPDVDGNFGFGATDIWVVKVDGNGLIQWQNQIGGNSFDQAFDIISTSDGGYLVVGNTYSTTGDALAITECDGTGNHGSVDIWVIKLSSTGNILWNNQLGGSSFDYGGTAVEMNNGYLICGESSSNNGDLALPDADGTPAHGSYDYYLAKLNKNTGVVIWDNAIGGSGLDVTNATPGLIATSDGNYLLCGRSNSTNGDALSINDVDGSTFHGSQDMWAVKVDPNGQILWHNIIGTSGWDEPHAAHVACDGGIVLSGYSDFVGIGGDKTRANPNGGRAPWLVKLNTTTGFIEWDYAFSSAGGVTTWDGPHLGLSYGSDADFFVIIDSLGGDYYFWSASANPAGGDKKSGIHGTQSTSNYDSWLVKLAFSKPTANFTHDTVCDGSPMSFTDLSSFMNIQPAPLYYWNFGDPASGAANLSNLKNPIHIFSGPGNYNVQLIVQYECKYDTITKTVIVDPIPTITSSGATLCSGSTRNLTATPSGGSWSVVSGPGTISGSTLSPTGTGTITIQYSLNGCTITQAINVGATVINNRPTQTSCDSIQVNGNWYFSNQTVSDTIVGGASNGCDSIINTPVIINTFQIINNNITVCAASLPVVIHGIPRGSAGVYSFTYTGANTCDSIVNTTLIISNAVVNNRPTQTSCDSIQVNGNWYFSNQTVSDTIVGGASNGCDSVVNTPVVIKNASFSTINTSFCGSYTSPSGKIFTTAGNYMDTIPNTNGCDSVISITLTNGPGTVYPVNLTACDSALINGTWYTFSQLVSDTFPTIGCDSIVNTTLSINNSTTGTINTTFCGSYTSPSGKIFTTAGNYMDTIPNTNGCDSVISITLTNGPGTVYPVNLTACDSALINGTWYTFSQLVSDTFPTIGCDSIVNTNLTINTPTNSTINVIGAGSYVSPSGNYTWTIAGTYTDTITNANGCDSVITIILTFGVVDSVSVTACDSALVQGFWYYNSQIINDTIHGGGPNGSDSVIVTTLTINYTVVYNAPQLVGCDSVVFNGITYYNNQIVSTIYPGASAMGCDSIVQTPIIINSASYTNLSGSFCNGDSVLVSGNYYSNVGTFYDTLSHPITGCDSILVITITIKFPEFGGIDTSICSNEILVIGGVTVTGKGLYYDTIPGGASNGCDLINIYNVTIKPDAIIKAFSPDSLLCFGDSSKLIAVGGNNYTWWNMSETGSGFYVKPTETTTYTVFDSTLCGIPSSQVTITVLDEAIFYVPNVFSPNGDNNNDVFQVKARGVESFYIMIYDRWGEKVFESEDVNETWDGTLRNKPMNVGVFVYYVKAKLKCGKEIEEKGEVSILK